jgi:hypothetical protein
LFSTKTHDAKIWFTHGLLDSEARIIGNEILFSEDNSIKNKVREYSQYWSILKPGLMALHDKRALAKELKNLKVKTDLVSYNIRFTKLCNYANVPENLKCD